MSRLNVQCSKVTGYPAADRVSLHLENKSRWGSENYKERYRRKRWPAIIAMSHANAFWQVVGLHSLLFKFRPSCSGTTEKKATGQPKPRRGASSSTIINTGPRDTATAVGGGSRSSSRRPSPASSPSDRTSSAPPRDRCACGRTWAPCGPHVPTGRYASPGPYYMSPCRSSSLARHDGAMNWKGWRSTGTELWGLWFVMRVHWIW
jgi:hypothetical protein